MGNQESYFPLFVLLGMEVDLYYEILSTQRFHSAFFLECEFLTSFYGPAAGQQQRVHLLQCASHVIQTVKLLRRNHHIVKLPFSSITSPFQLFSLDGARISYFEKRFFVLLKLYNSANYTLFYKIFRFMKNKK